MSVKRISLFPILTVNFIGTLGFSIVLPFLVFLVTRFGGNSIAYGIMGSVYPAFQLIGAPFLGRWSDVYGRKKVLLLSSFGTIAGWVIFFISFFLPMVVIFKVNFLFFGMVVLTLPLLVLFLARAIDGLTGANISIANAYLSDITQEKERNKNFGKMSISSNLGFILGPAIAGILGGTVYGEMLPVIAALAISIVSAFVIFFFLPESKPLSYEEPQAPGIEKILGCEQRASFETKTNNRRSSRVSFKKVLGIKYVPFFLLLNFLIFLGFNFFYTAFPVHVVQKLGWSVAEMGAFYSILSLIMVVFQGPVLTFASKHFSDKKLVLTGSFILGANFILLLSDDMFVLYSAAVLFAAGNGLMWPSFLSLLSKIAGSTYQGSVQGFASSAGSLASIIGLITGGFLYSIAGTAVFVVAASVIYLVFLLSFRMPDE